MILIPGRMGQLDVSNKSSRRKQANMHLDSLPVMMTEAIEKQLAEMKGDPVRLREYYFSRWAWNCWAFPTYARSREHTNFDVTQPRLF